MLKKCCMCGDVFEVGFEMPDGDMVCANYECCYHYCKTVGERVFQESEVADADGRRNPAQDERV